MPLFGSAPPQFEARLLPAQQGVPLSVPMHAPRAVAQRVARPPALQLARAPWSRACATLWQRDASARVRCCGVACSYPPLLLLGHPLVPAGLQVQDAPQVRRRAHQAGMCSPTSVLFLKQSFCFFKSYFSCAAQPLRDSTRPPHAPQPTYALRRRAATLNRRSILGFP